MTTGCSKECVKYSNICDFCQYYEYHGRGHMKNGVIIRDAVYVDAGWCILSQHRRNPEESCNKFYCSNLPPLKANKDWVTQSWLEKKIKYKPIIVKTTTKGNK